MRQHVGQLTEEQAILERQKESLQKDVDLMAKDAERIGTTTFELEMKRKEIEQADAIIKDLRKQKAVLSVENLGTLKRMTNLYNAEVPQGSNFKTRIQMAIAGAVGVFLLTCGLISFLELRARRIFSSDEVSHELGMRILGSLPNLPARSRDTQEVRVGGVDADALLTESIDSIRAMLLCDDDLRAHRVLMVTSARSGEGKTTLACHLAASIARGGYRTLLIDCDFRKPAIHQLFGIPSQVGLSEVLTAQMDVAQAITPSPIDGLYILQAGAPRRETVSLLGKDCFRKTLETLRGQFDFLVVDSCPVLPVADSLMVGKHADSVVLSVRPNVSQAPQLAAAYQRLTALRILVLGVVVTGESLRSKAYGDLYPMLESQPK